MKDRYFDCILGQLHGQLLVEFSIATFLLLILIPSGCVILKLHWERTRCSYLVFEKTHAYLIGKSNSSGVPSVQFEDLIYGVRGVGICNGAKEQVELPYLESAKW